MAGRSEAVTDASREMARVLATAPVRASLDRGWTGVTAQHWRHAPLHDRVAPMTEHVIMTYFGTPRRIERRDGRAHDRSLTRPDSVTLIPAGHEARWDIHGPLDVVHLYVSPARLAAVADEHGLAGGAELLDRVGAVDPVGSRLLAGLAAEMETPGALDGLYAEQIAALLCTHMLRAHRAAGPASHGSEWRGGLAPRQLRRVLALMEERLAEDVRLEDLAEAAGLSSPVYFGRAFRRATGQTPHRYLVEKRVERAKTLLASSGMPLAEIAGACGFSSQSHLSTWFNRLAGTTAGRFRSRT